MLDTITDAKGEQYPAHYDTLKFLVANKLDCSIESCPKHDMIQQAAVSFQTTPKAEILALVQFDRPSWSFELDVYSLLKQSGVDCIAKFVEFGG
jgi:hypothetical protein